MKKQSDFILYSIQVENTLSFGPDAKTLDLEPLSVLIGPNGVGKSNIFDILRLVRALTGERTLQEVISKGGGITQWLWRHQGELSVILLGSYQDTSNQVIIYEIIIGPQGTRSAITRESIIQYEQDIDPLILCNIDNSLSTIQYNSKSNKSNTIKISSPTTENSILSNNTISSEILNKGASNKLIRAVVEIRNILQEIYIYSDWTFGRDAPIRKFQPADLTGEFLLPDLSNLGLVLSELRMKPQIWRKLIKELRQFIESVDDLIIHTQNNMVQISVVEGDTVIPATRLSDGTLRYICLLAILCHPEPPAIIGIEEPELGMHPDMIPEIARLLVEASERTQLIVTTHSDILISALSDHPESIVVCERDEEGTTMRRLDAEEMAVLLEENRLGELWTRGVIGGTRW